MLLNNLDGGDEPRAGRQVTESAASPRHGDRPALGGDRDLQLSRTPVINKSPTSGRCAGVLPTCQ